jgi:hypothetical protein
MLMAFGLFVSLGLFVTVLAVIDKSADWRRGVGSDLDQIDRVVSRQVQCFVQREHPQLRAIEPNNPHLAGTDFAINPYERI